MTARDARTPAEWFSFVVACLILSGVIALIGVKAAEQDDAARPIARQIGTITATSSGYRVPVEVRNEGSLTASEVQVRAELTIGGEVTDGDQVIDFLAGDDAEELVFVFPSDPADGELTIRVTSYGSP